MKIFVAVLILSLILVCLSCQTRNNQITSNELQIYKTLLTNKPKEIVVIDESKIGVFGEIETGGLKQILKRLQDDTFESLAKRNSISTDIVFYADSSFDYQILNRKDFETKKGNSVKYYLFSRVGFSKDSKQAVVMFTEVCEPLCSKGAYYLLSNKNGIWEIEEESENWRS